MFSSLHLFVSTNCKLQQSQQIQGWMTTRKEVAITRPCTLEMNIAVVSLNQPSLFTLLSIILMPCLPFNNRLLAFPRRTVPSLFCFFFFVLLSLILLISTQYFLLLNPLPPFNPYIKSRHTDMYSVPGHSNVKDT